MLRTVNNRTWLICQVLAAIIAVLGILSYFLVNGSGILSAIKSVDRNSTVRGRVVDSRGVAVTNAEVLLLGDERVIVDARSRKWSLVPPNHTRPVAPPTARTNSNGEFSIVQTSGTANRVAIIADNPLLWVVSRQSQQSGENAVIRLPASGSIAVRCDLPGKPATQPIMIMLKTFDGIEWNPDVLRFHWASFAVTNPGETIFEHLPPGTYSVEREQRINIANNEIISAAADRQLVEVESEKCTIVKIERNNGKPLVGRVLGLESVDLRVAHITVMYPGPEEGLKKNGQRARIMTAFEIIPITSSGEFTTDPIPPGQYSLQLFAIRSSTPRQGVQRPDFSGGKQLIIPETGGNPEVRVIAKPRLVQ